jgi:hypothetical protein
MRIAVSGTHCSGKTTLVEELSGLLPAYEVVHEPYHLLVEDGYDFNHPPSLEDFEAQLQRSLEELRARRKDALFDRCPFDVLAYISAHEDGEAFDLDEWLPRIRSAMQALDLIVFVPIEEPDRMASAVEDEDDGEYRSIVDEKLRELLVDDSLDLGVEVLVVEGTTTQRAAAALRRVR